MGKKKEDDRYDCSAIDFGGFFYDVFGGHLKPCLIQDYLPIRYFDRWLGLWMPTVY
jgi:hypothetical protein